MTRPRQQEQELGDSHRRAIDHVPWVESIREGCWAATRATAPVNLLEASILMKRTMGQMDGWRRAVVWMKFEGRGVGAGRNEFVWLEGDEGAGFPQAGGGSLVLLAAQEQQERATSRSPPWPALGSSGEITRWRRKGLSATMTDQSSPLRPRCNGAGGLTRAPCPCLFCRDLGELVDTSGEGSKGNGKRAPQGKQWLQHRIQPSFHVEAASLDAASKTDNIVAENLFPDDRWPGGQGCVRLLARVWSAV